MGSDEDEIGKPAMEVADEDENGDGNPDGWPSAVVENARDSVEKWCREHLEGRGYRIEPTHDDSGRYWRLHCEREDDLDAAIDAIDTARDDEEEEPYPPDLSEEERQQPVDVSGFELDTNSEANVGPLEGMTAGRLCELIGAAAAVQCVDWVRFHDGGEWDMYRPLEHRMRKLAEAQNALRARDYRGALKGLLAYWDEA